jgi:SAM-dependent methyltransferase
MGYAFEVTRRIARSLLPDRLRSAAWRQLRGLARRPPVGFVRFGSLRRVTPISSNWGADQGRPIDRYYIEQFLSRWAADVRGFVLEIQEDLYTRRFGGDRVKKLDVLSVAPGNPLATIVADLEDAKNIPDGSYDCIIATQTLQLIYNFDAAIRTMHRTLRPGGVALITVPGISKIARDEIEGWSTQWHFSEQSATKAFSKIFGEENVTAEAQGNVLAAIAFLHGLALSELSERELQHKDRDFPLIIEVRAQKPRMPQ